mmetsp:Transcript_128621/g.274432  ORF Transcript_128621/g.274432 Transcript_128621/m.274432 type:complete len:317 (+) Transcript_128621:73-1023(+)|eukprot:CAMPEP_0180429808 /NCGR_PEP_ID=MMETSP1036_2-20121128/7563_1 /TAXON_ID=632150 /ORGANISM="Azadinium spinosum, Strain 3D9" /LENGTH=316 /DNA_ID=CAMNT_0022435527 /DNA_START=64 /DNA_END=1014 /DNA_ORIENTATION=-
MGSAHSSLDNKYFVQKVKLGQGAFATVWRGVDRRDESVVAIKQLDKAQLRIRGLYQEDIEREIDVMQACQHTNLIRLLDRFEDMRHIFLAIEYCDGGDFGDKLKERGAYLDDMEAASWMHDICSAIAVLHMKGVCHRDVKPDNFMVSRHKLKLADFGLAVFVQPGVLLTDKWGTPAFMAPEQHLLPMRSRGYSFPVDMWAAGVTMHMMLHGGRQPFFDSYGNLDIRGIVEGKPDEPGGLEQVLTGNFGLGSRFSEAAHHLCRRMMETRPDLRCTADSALRSSWLGMVVKQGNSWDYHGGPLPTPLGRRRPVLGRLR